MAARPANAFAVFARAAFVVDAVAGALEVPVAGALPVLLVEEGVAEEGEVPVDFDALADVDTAADWEADPDAEDASPEAVGTGTEPVKVTPTAAQSVWAAVRAA